MSYIESLSWLLVIVSLTGNYYVVKRKVLGQWLWAIGNVGWIAYDLSIGAYSQAFLFVIYLGFCIWGIIEWSKE